MRRHGFTLMEVLVATAIAGLVISAGFRLIGMSYSLLGEIQAERELIYAAQDIWLRFRVDKDMSDNGRDDDTGVSWETREITIPVEEYEITYKAVTVKIASGRSTVIYVSD